ncbi:MAG: xanthine dehydrogenase family protein subunit M [Burkholderiaceae bacterium]|nr:xanthine dehydrogenase family protein subunit M [Burkholderiaceae bacterium]
MKPAAFTYHRPASLDEALALLHEFGAQARLLAGGQSLGPMLNLRFARPAHVIDLNDLTEFAYVRDAGDSVEVGGLTRHYQLADSAYLHAHCPLLAQAAKTIGHYAIRQRGTLGGSLANADPVAQLALVAVALDARITLVRQGGRREVAAHDFFQAAMTTALAPQELLLSVRFPRFRAGEVSAYRMFNRRHGDYAVVGVAATLAVDGGQVQRLRLALSGIGAVPQRLDAVTRSFEGRQADAVWAHEVAAATAESLTPDDDERVPASYRRELAHSLTLRALARTLEKLEGRNV